MLVLCMSRLSRLSLGMLMETHAQVNVQSTRLGRQAYLYLTSTITDAQEVQHFIKHQKQFPVGKRIVSLHWVSIRCLRDLFSSSGKIELNPWKTLLRETKSFMENQILHLQFESLQMLVKNIWINMEQSLNSLQKSLRRITDTVLTTPTANSEKSTH